MTYSTTHTDPAVLYTQESTKTKKDDLSMQEIGYLMLMWAVLAINVMLITFINNSFTHCL